MAMVQESRHFIRHTIDVPLEVTTVAAGTALNPLSLNVSHGGLAFEVDECLDIGQLIHLRIPTVNPPFEADARVVWCRPEGDRYLAGAAFINQTAAFQSRMVEQICAIEEYRKEVLHQEGRALTPQDAAAEWIERYAGRFPAADGKRET
jgi:hypothetical protein